MTNRLDFLTKEQLKATLGYLREQVYTLSLNKNEDLWSFYDENLFRMQHKFF